MSPLCPPPPRGAPRGTDSVFLVGLKALTTSPSRAGAVSPPGAANRFHTEQRQRPALQAPRERGKDRVSWTPPPPRLTGEPQPWVACCLPFLAKGLKAKPPSLGASGLAENRVLVSGPHRGWCVKVTEKPLHQLTCFPPSSPADASQKPAAERAVGPPCAEAVRTPGRPGRPSHGRRPGPGAARPPLTQRPCPALDFARRPPLLNTVSCLLDIHPASLG